MAEAAIFSSVPNSSSQSESSSPRLINQVSESKSVSTRSFSRTPSSWDPQDDILLRHLKEQQKLGWKEIASHFTHRTPNACQFRWRRLKSGSLKHSVVPVGSATSAASIAASFSEAKIRVKNKSVNSALAGLSALSTGLRNQDDKFRSKPTSKNENLAPPNYTKWSFTANPTGIPSGIPSSSAANAATAAASTNYPTANQMNNNYAPATNDTLSNSISSLSSFESTTSSNSLSYPKFSPEPWTSQEDDLLSSKKGKELSLTELSILMPWRSEEEILNRMKILDQVKKQQLHNIALGLARSTSYFDSNGNEILNRNGTGINGTGINGTGTNGSGFNGTGFNGTGFNGTGFNGTGFNGTGFNGTVLNNTGLNSAGLTRTLSTSSELSLGSNTSSTFSYSGAGSFTRRYEKRDMEAAEKIDKPDINKLIEHEGEKPVESRDFHRPTASMVANNLSLLNVSETVVNSETS